MLNLMYIFDASSIFRVMGLIYIFSWGLLMADKKLQIVMTRVLNQGSTLVRLIRIFDRYSSLMFEFNAQL